MRHFVGFFILMGSITAANRIAGAGDSSAPASAGVPVRFTLDRPSYVTLVIDDGSGNRVRTLLSSARLPGGDSTVWWDGCDEGRRDSSGALVRHRVTAGTYHARGLVHDGVRMRYEFTVNNPGTPPWKTLNGSGGWLADHTPPADVLELPTGARAPEGKTRGPGSWSARARAR